MDTLPQLFPSLEIWKPVPRNPNYEVSSLGRVRAAVTRRGATKGKIIRPLPSGDGYLKVSLYADHGRVRTGIHRLVAEAFIGPPPDGHEANHKNTITTDNRAENLEWLSHSDNMKHAFRMGRIRIPTKGGGERVGNHKLTESQVRRIRELAAGGESRKSISRQFGVCVSNVDLIVRRVTWKCV